MKYAITAIIFLIAGFFLARSCSEETITQTLVDGLKADKIVKQAQINKLEKEKAILFWYIDSLQKEREKIEPKINKEIAKTDEIIAKDSTKSIPEMRTSLALWGVKPDKTEYPTYREFGFAAKHLRKGYGFGLQLANCEETEDSLESLVNKQEKLIEAKNNIIKTDESIISGLELLVKEAEPDFWQKYSMIAIYIILAFVGGIMVVL